MVIGTRLILLRALCLPVAGLLALAGMIRLQVLKGGVTTPAIASLEIGCWTLGLIGLCAGASLDWHWRRRARLALARSPRPCAVCLDHLLIDDDRLRCASCGYKTRSRATLERDWGWAWHEGAFMHRRRHPGQARFIGRRLSILRNSYLLLVPMVMGGNFFFQWMYIRNQASATRWPYYVGVIGLILSAACFCLMWVPLLLSWRLIRQARAAVQSREYACARCFYPLRTSDDQMLCPECGYQAIDVPQLKRDWGKAWPARLWGR